jgi:hypothetical protein
MSAEDQLEPVFGPDGQPDAATLAGLELDAFDAVTTARIRSRIRNSTQAQETLAALDAVRAQLHAQPAPKMPEAVADRISAALRAEQSARSAGQRPDSGPPVPPANVTSLAAARERRSQRTRWMGLAAAGVAVVAAGGIIYGVTAQSTTSGKGSNNPPQAFGQHSTPSSADGHVHPNGVPNLGKLPEYSADSLAGKLPDIVRTAKVGVTPPGNHVAGPDITSCTRRLGQQQPPIAVQHATFDQRDAYVFVFVFVAGTGHQARVYVVGPSCTGDPIYQTSGSY